MDSARPSIYHRGSSSLFTALFPAHTLGPVLGWGTPPNVLTTSPGTVHPDPALKAICAPNLSHLKMSAPLDK